MPQWAEQKPEPDELYPHQALQPAALHQDRDDEGLRTHIQMQYPLHVWHRWLETSTPMCDRSNTQKMMDMLSMMDNITCPFACISEWIDTSISFTLLSDSMFQNACKHWKICDGLTKQDAAWMDLYFTSLQTEVSTINHQDKSSLLDFVGDSDCPSDYPGPAQQYWGLSWTILGGKHIFSHWSFYHIYTFYGFNIKFNH